MDENKNEAIYIIKNMHAFRNCLKNLNGNQMVNLKDYLIFLELNGHNFSNKDIRKIVLSEFDQSALSNKKKSMLYNDLIENVSRDIILNKKGKTLVNKLSKERMKNYECFKALIGDISEIAVNNNMKLLCDEISELLDVRYCTDYLERIIMLNGIYVKIISQLNISFLDLEVYIALKSTDTDSLYKDNITTILNIDISTGNYIWNLLIEKNYITRQTIASDAVPAYIDYENKKRECDIINKWFYYVVSDEGEKFCDELEKRLVEEVDKNLRKYNKTSIEKIGMLSSKLVTLLQKKSFISFI